MEITYQRRKCAKRSDAFNATELEAKLKRDLETAGIFVKESDTSTGTGTTGGSFSYGTGSKTTTDDSTY